MPLVWGNYNVKVYLFINFELYVKVCSFKSNVFSERELTTFIIIHYSMIINSSVTNEKLKSGQTNNLK